MAICGEPSSSFLNIQTPSGWDPSVQEFSGVAAIRNMVGHFRHMLRRTACKALGSQCERWWWWSSCDCGESERKFLASVGKGDGRRVCFLDKHWIDRQLLNELMNQQIHSSNVHWIQPCARRCTGPSDADADVSGSEIGSSGSREGGGRGIREVSLPFLSSGTGPDPAIILVMLLSPPPLPTLIFLL